MIDIIIPAYNSHKTIINTLLSINMQSIKDKVKVYIINDNSNKNYDEEVMLFKNKLNIQSIDIDKNCGPGHARNVGLNCSKGEYILFLDSDDELYNSLSLELLLNSIQDSDLSIGGVLTEYDNKEYEYISNSKASLHGKLYKRKSIVKNNLSFNNTYSSEDNAFHNLFLLCEPKVSYINEPVYFYKYNKNSLSDITYDKFIVSYNYNVNWAINEAINREIDEYLIAKYFYKSFIYNYHLFLKFNKDFAELINSFKKYLLCFYDKYIFLLNENEKQAILNEYLVEIDDSFFLDDFIKLLEK